jgi:membrane-associated phospholipid phosphatase
MFEILTDFGDATLILPAALLLALYFWASGARRVAFAWLTALAASILLISLSKLAFQSCDEWLGASEIEIHSPSGHVAFATILYGGVAWLLSKGQTPTLRIATGLAAATMIGIIAMSRVALHYHTVPEVLAGFALGAAGIWVFHLLSRRCADIHLPSRGALAVFAALALLSHGYHIDAERWIAQIASTLRTDGELCTARASAHLAAIAIPGQ